MTLKLPWASAASTITLRGDLDAELDAHPATAVVPRTIVGVTSGGDDSDRGTLRGRLGKGGGRAASSHRRRRIPYRLFQLVRDHLQGGAHEDVGSYIRLRETRRAARGTCCTAPQCSPRPGSCTRASARTARQSAPDDHVALVHVDERRDRRDVVREAERQRARHRVEELRGRVGNGLPASGPRAMRSILAARSRCPPCSGGRCCGRSDRRPRPACRRPAACRASPSGSADRDRRTVNVRRATGAIPRRATGEQPLERRSSSRFPGEPDAHVDRMHRRRARLHRRRAPRCRGRRRTGARPVESGDNRYIPVIRGKISLCLGHQAHRLLLRPSAARLRRHLQASARPQRGGGDRDPHRLARQRATWCATSATSSASSRAGSIASSITR